MNNNKSTIQLIAITPADGQKAHLQSLINRYARLRLLASFHNLTSLKAALGKLDDFDILLIFDEQVVQQLHLIRLVKQIKPNIEILLFCPSPPTETLLKVLSSGISGFMLPTTEADDMVSAIFELSGGGAPFSPIIGRQIVGHFQRQTNSPQPPLLTCREQQVADALVKGLSYKQIAFELDIALETVRHHIKNIYAKYGVHSKTQLIATLNKA